METLEYLEYMYFKFSKLLTSSEVELMETITRAL